MGREGRQPPARSVSTAVLTRSVEGFIKIVSARPKLLKRLAEAKKPVNLAAILSTEAGTDEFLKFRGTMTDPTFDCRYTGAQRSKGRSGRT